MCIIMYQSLKCKLYVCTLHIYSHGNECTTYSCLYVCFDIIYYNIAIKLFLYSYNHVCVGHYYYNTLLGLYCILILQLTLLVILTCRASSTTSADITPLTSPFTPLTKNVTLSPSFVFSMLVMTISSAETTAIFCLNRGKICDNSLIGRTVKEFL